MKKLALAFLALLALSASAGAQPVPQPVANAGNYGAYNAAPPTCVDGTGCWLQTDVNGKLLVAASVSATVTGFTPGLTYASLTATASSASVALPAGTTVSFQNTGTTTVSCTLGVGSATATAGQIQVPASSTVFITPGANTFGACIDESGSASNVIRLAGGSGLGTGFGGGGGGGGSGGSVTQGTDPWLIAGKGTAGTASGGVVTVQGVASMTKLLVTPDSVALPANQSVNEAQINGVTPLMGNGVTGTGSQRVTIASDNTAFGVNASIPTWAGGTLGAMANYGTSPGAVLVPGVNAFVTNATPGIANNADAIATVAASSSSPVPVNSYGYIFNGTTMDRMRSGTTTGSVLINGPGTAGSAAGGILTVQGVASMTKLLVTPDSVALPANQSVNTAQVNGITTLTGTGAVGTGAQRVAVGTDTATIAGSAPGTAGTASANVLTVQGVASMTKLLVTPDALPANQSVNLAQVAGATTAVGSGVQATALRTTLATDSPGIVTLGPATAANSVPVTIGPTLLGSYCMGANTGTMAAGLAAGSPIYSFRYGGANLAIVRKVSAEADDITTAFVAGAGKLDMIAARSFSASDTGGTAATLTGNNGKLRTSFATTAVSDLRISSTATLTAGTRTLDAQPLASTEFAVSTSIDAALLPTTALFQSAIGESPFVLANNEGFVIQATVPGTGTWVASVRVCWDEVTAF